MEQALVIKNKYIVFTIIIMILSTTYIALFEYYDRPITEIQELKELIEVKEGSLETVEVQLVGREANKKDDMELMNIQKELTKQMNHRSSCSRLCNKHHTGEFSISTNNDDESIITHIVSDQNESEYKLSIINDENKGTQYNFNLSSLANLKLLDSRTSRCKEFFRKINVISNETIYFEGEISGYLSEKKRKKIAIRVLKSLGSNIDSEYNDDITGVTSAYYGYTNKYDEYIISNNGKSNVEINFSYDENSDKTEYIVAFPFCNKPY